MPGLRKPQLVQVKVRVSPRRRTEKRHAAALQVGLQRWVDENADAMIERMLAEDEKQGRGEEWKAKADGEAEVPEPH